MNSKNILDDTIDYTYMLNSTVKHNELNSMKYLQKKLIAHKDNKMLERALEYANKSQSIETTLHPMQQKIKLNEFTINFDKARVYINTYATNYPLDFINKFETSLYNNGFNKWHDELLSLCEKEDMMAYSEISHLLNQINKSLYNNNLDMYNFINLEML